MSIEYEDVGKRYAAFFDCWKDILKQLRLDYYKLCFCHRKEMLELECRIRGIAAGEATPGSYSGQVDRRVIQLAGYEYSESVECLSSRKTDIIERVQANAVPSF